MARNNNIGDKILGVFVDKSLKGTIFLFALFYLDYCLTDVKRVDIKQCFS
jgi:hypothetical protein